MGYGCCFSSAGRIPLKQRASHRAGVREGVWVGGGGGRAECARGCCSRNRSQTTPACGPLARLVRRALLAAALRAPLVFPETIALLPFPVTNRFEFLANANAGVAVAWRRLRAPSWPVQPLRHPTDTPSYTPSLLPARLIPSRIHSTQHHEVTESAALPPFRTVPLTCTATRPPPPARRVERAVRRERRGGRQSAEPPCGAAQRDCLPCRRSAPRAGRRPWPLGDRP